MIISHSGILQMLVNRDFSLNTERSKNAEKMSSGYKMNRAADNCSGLAIYKHIHMRIGGIEVAKRNTQDGASLMQTIDGGLQDLQNQLGRVKELSVKSLNGNLTDDDRKQIQLEIDQIKKGIDTTSQDMQFNGIKVLGQDADMKIKVMDDPEVNFKLKLYDCSTKSLGISNLDLSNTVSGNAALGQVNAAIEKVNGFLVSNGAGENNLNQIGSILSNMSYNFNASESNINDTDMVSGQMEQTRISILQNATTAMFSQVSNITQQSLSVLG